MNIDHSDLYNVFDTEQFDYYYPITWEGRDKEYLKMKETPTITWDYRSTVSFPIDLTDYLEIVGENNIVVRFYNFRYEEMYSQTFSAADIDPEDNSVRCNIDKQTSSSIFEKGIYKMGITIENDDEDGEVIVVLSPDDYLIYVN